MKRFLCVVLSFALCFGICSLAACGQSTRGHLITMQNEAGTVLGRDRAEKGELVTLRSAKAGYHPVAVYLNGRKLAGDTFVMPDEDVTALVVLGSNAENAHTVTVSETGELGRTIADFSAAETGETVTLTTYVSYGNSVLEYLVDGKAIDGNSFTMPDRDVVVSVRYTQLLRSGGLTLSATQSYETATSHWYAGYTENGLTVEAVVEDNIIFTDTEYLDSIAYGDNVEFIVGPHATATGLDASRYKVLVSANGSYFFEHYQGGWVAANGKIDVLVRPCELSAHGFNGYWVNVFLPFTSLGVRAEEELCIAPAMRNTLNALKTVWTSYSGMRCNWDDAKTHLLVETDGTFLASDVKGGSLFVGDGLLSRSAWGNFYENVNGIGSVYSIAAGGADAAYWTENIGLITERVPEKIYFSSGAGEGSVLAAFSSVRTFLEKIGIALPETEITVISPIPSLSDDPAKAAALSGMLKDLLTEMDIPYIDFCSELLKDGTPKRGLYASPLSLSEEGYALLGKLILLHEGAYGGARGIDWGDCDCYVSAGAWTESGETLRLRSGGTRRIYYKTPLSGDFDFRLELGALTVYNGDAYPKFGFSLQDGFVSYSFYINGENGLTGKRAGIVPYVLGLYDWANSSETNVPDLVYAGGRQAVLRLKREGETIAFYVNDTQVFAGTLGYGKEVTLGLFSFNTALDVQNWTVEGGKA